MAYGDIGGAVTELLITCVTPATGIVYIEKGDAVKLVGDYTITNKTESGDVIFGQAMAAATENGVAIPIKVRGICIFDCDGPFPKVDGTIGVVASDESGMVQAPINGNGTGIVVKVDEEAKEVHVLK